VRRIARSLDPGGTVSLWGQARLDNRLPGAALGLPAPQIDREVAEFRVLRRVSLAATDHEALADTRRALRWETATARRVHQAGRDAGADARLADGSGVGEATEVTGGCVGTPQTVLRELLALRNLGVRHVIAWLNFGDMPFAKVRRSMELLAREVIPALAEPGAPAGTGAPHGQLPVAVAAARGRA
jgi:hypothetical protein